MSVQQSALQDRHEALGAKFAEFGGWRMPLEYAGVIAEHTAVRGRVGLFDVSHLGKLVVRGTGARDFVNACLTNDLGKIEPGKAQYTLCCAEDGGVVDDMIVYYRADDDLLLVPNAANNDEVRRRLEEAAPAGVEVLDQHHDLVVLAVQGPYADPTLQAAGLPTGHPYMSYVDAELDGTEVVVCRSGYTGERGYELLAPAEAGGRLWDALMAAGAEQGIAPCGLGARDTLRTEMGYPLHGQDLGPDISPVQARLGWAVGWRKPAFWGRDALLAEREAGPAVRLRGLRATGRGIPRPGMSVRLTRDLPVGRVTSGTFSPVLRRGVGLALLSSEVEPGAEVLVDVRGRAEAFEVVAPPFVQTQVKES